MIVKIQRPLVTTEGESLCLIYNKDRSVFLQHNINPWPWGHTYKVYAEAEIQETQLVIGELVQDQRW